MFAARSILLSALAGLALTSLGAGSAHRSEQIELKRSLRLSGDFRELEKCTVSGPYRIVAHDGQPALATDAPVAIAFRQPLPAPYSASAWVRLPAKRGAGGRCVLTAAGNERGGYQLEIEYQAGAIDIRALANGCNLWARSTYKFREGTGPEHLRYHLKLDPQELARKLEGLENALKGRSQEWQEWGLGTRGEMVEHREVDGLHEVIRANDAAPDAAERWTQMTIDLSADMVRMWVDGRLVGEVRDAPSLAGEVVLALPAGAMLHSLEVTDSPQGRQSLLTLDLAGYYNHASRTVTRRPAGLIRVQGVPFLLNQGPDKNDAIDVGMSAPLETGFGHGFLGSAFEKASGLIRHPSRIVLQVPKGWYNNLYLLAYSEKSAETEPVVSFRFFRNERSGTVVDYTCRVPAWDESGVGQGVASVKLAGPQGQELFWHVIRVPLEPALMQNSLEKTFVRDLQVEITKGLHFTRSYPDPAEYTSLAAGRRSAVRIVALTLEEAPLQMAVTTDEVGHLIVEPEEPALNVLVRNTAAEDHRGRLEITTEDPYGTRQELEDDLDLPRRCGVTKRYRLPLEKYGLYHVSVELSGAGVTHTKSTTLGYLPPDKRKATWRDSFFGIWTWGGEAGGYAYPIRSEETLRLVWKLGGRWGLAVEGDTALGKHYGITHAWSFLPTIDFPKVPEEQWEAGLKERMLEGLRTQRAAFPDQDLYLMFGEANLGQKQTYAVPGRYYGEPDYSLNDKEQEKFDRMFREAALVGKTLRALKQAHPELANVKLTFGNTSPNFPIEFLKRGLPREFIDVFGIDVPYFERMPERQPRAVEASQLLYLYDFRKESKCEDIPICGTEDMYYPACPGSLSQREQADYYVRCHLLKLAMGVNRESAVGMIFSTSGPYGRCHYGATGFFEVSPEGGGDGNPRESAVAYATMTRILDGPKYLKHFPTSSLSTFCLALSRKFGQGDVLALWTLHGTRQVTLTIDGPVTPRITDAMGNSHPAAVPDGTLTVDVSSSPVWVEGVPAARVKTVAAGAPAYSDNPAEPAALVDDFDTPWRELPERDLSFEENNFDLPRFLGKMTASPAPGMDGGKSLEIALVKPDKERKLAPWYASFAPPKPIVLPGRPTEIGFYAKGNSGWGRIIPQLTDAKGEVWTFIGPKDEWNSDDIRSQSSVDFDGWKYMELELPTNLPNGWPGPGMAFWKNEKGDRLVDYPLRLTKLLVEQRTHIYYVNEIVPVPEPAIAVDKIVCSHAAPYVGLHLSKGR
jgi:hypothetical protein